MFTETLEDALDNAGLESNLVQTETSLTANNSTGDEEGDEATVSLDVKDDGEDTVTVSIVHPDGEWKGVFHTYEDSYEQLAQVIADEYSYWLEN